MNPAKMKLNDTLFRSLTDGRVTSKVAAHVLREKLAAGDADDTLVLEKLIEAAQSKQGEEQWREAANKYNAMIEELQGGTLRTGYYLGVIRGVGVSTRA